MLYGFCVLGAFSAVASVLKKEVTVFPMGRGLFPLPKSGIAAFFLYLPIIGKSEKNA